MPIGLSTPLLLPLPYFVSTFMPIKVLQWISLAYLMRPILLLYNAIVSHPPFHWSKSTCSDEMWGCKYSCTTISEMIQSMQNALSKGIIAPKSTGAVIRELEEWSLVWCKVLRMQGTVKWPQNLFRHLLFFYPTAEVTAQWSKLDSSLHNATKILTTYCHLHVPCKAMSWH